LFPAKLFYIFFDFYKISTTDSEIKESTVDIITAVAAGSTSEFSWADNTEIAEFLRP